MQIEIVYKPNVYKY